MGADACVAVATVESRVALGAARMGLRANGADTAASGTAPGVSPKPSPSRGSLTRTSDRRILDRTLVDFSCGKKCGGRPSLESLRRRGPEVPDDIFGSREWGPAMRALAEAAVYISAWRWLRALAEASKDSQARDHHVAAMIRHCYAPDCWAPIPGHDGCSDRVALPRPSF